MEREPLKELRTIPGVGKSIARDLYNIGIRSVRELATEDPDELYARSNKRAGRKQDRCLLYVFRCAVYFARTEHPKPELTKWWNWSDAKWKPSLLRSY